MNQLVCEMCGSSDLIKNDGVFVCQSCGCKYSVEEAKKMMIDGVVEVTGNIKVDSSENIEKLRGIAKNSYDIGFFSEASNSYEKILELKPDDFDALFMKGLIKEFETDECNGNEFLKFAELSKQSYLENHSEEEFAYRRNDLAIKLLGISKNIYSTSMTYLDEHYKTEETLLKFYNFLFKGVMFADYAKTALESEDDITRDEYFDTYKEICLLIIKVCNEICSERDSDDIFRDRIWIDAQNGEKYSLLGRDVKKSLSDIEKKVNNRKIETTKKYWEDKQGLLKEKIAKLNSENSSLQVEITKTAEEINKIELEKNDLEKFINKKKNLFMGDDLKEKTDAQEKLKLVYSKINELNIKINNVIQKKALNETELNNFNKNLI